MARRVDRNSHSKYMINGYDSTFKEVCELLSRKGIDLEHNRFLILQGEVEQISLMKPIAQSQNEVGLLEYLEDIIGSNKHIEQIDELEGALSHKNDERIEKINRVKQSKAELDNLEEEKDVAVVYIRKEREYLLLSNLLLYAELGESVALYNESVEKIARLRDILNQKKVEMRAKFQENAELVTEIGSAQAEIAGAQARRKELSDQFQELQKTDVAICTEKEHLNEEIEKLGETVQRQEQAKQRLKEEAQTSEQELPRLVEEVKEQRRMK